MKVHLAAFVSLWALSILSACSEQPGTLPADLVIRGGRILTLDEAIPDAEAMAVNGKEIVFLGTEAEVGSFVGVNTRVIDLEPALLHDSDRRTGPPDPGPESCHSVAFWHPKPGHPIEDLARQLYFDPLSVEGSTSHSSAHDRLVPEDSILDHGPPTVAGTRVPFPPTWESAGTP